MFLAHFIYYWGYFLDSSYINCAKKHNFLLFVDKFLVCMFFDAPYILLRSK